MDVDEDKPVVTIPRAIAHAVRPGLQVRERGVRKSVPLRLRLRRIVESKLSSISSVPTTRKSQVSICIPSNSRKVDREQVPPPKFPLVTIIMKTKPAIHDATQTPLPLKTGATPHRTKRAPLPLQLRLRASTTRTQTKSATPAELASPMSPCMEEAGVDLVQEPSSSVDGTDITELRNSVPLRLRLVGNEDSDDSTKSGNHKRPRDDLNQEGVLKTPSPIISTSSIPQTQTHNESASKIQNRNGNRNVSQISTSQPQAQTRTHCDEKTAQTQTTSIYQIPISQLQETKQLENRQNANSSPTSISQSQVPRRTEKYASNTSPTSSQSPLQIQLTDIVDQFKNDTKSSRRCLPMPPPETRNLFEKSEIKRHVFRPPPPPMEIIRNIPTQKRNRQQTIENRRRPRSVSPQSHGNSSSLSSSVLEIDESECHRHSQHVTAKPVWTEIDIGEISDDDDGSVSERVEGDDELRVLPRPELRHVVQASTAIKAFLARKNGQSPPSPQPARRLTAKPNTNRTSQSSMAVPLSQLQPGTIVLVCLPGRPYWPAVIGRSNQQKYLGQYYLHGGLVWVFYLNDYRGDWIRHSDLAQFSGSNVNAMCTISPQTPNYEAVINRMRGAIQDGLDRICDRTKSRACAAAAGWKPNLGEIVFAKVEPYPHWPATVVGVRLGGLYLCSIIGGGSGGGEYWIAKSAVRPWSRSISPMQLRRNNILYDEFQKSVLIAQVLISEGKDGALK